MKKVEFSWQSVGHLLEDSAIKYGEKVLFSYEGNNLSFKEVNSMVNRTANALKKLGVKHGDKVSVMLPNGFEYPVCWLAIMKIGAVIVPTNINYQKRDLEYVLNNSEASFIILHEDYLSRFEEIKVKIPSIKEVVVVGNDASSYHSYQEIIKNVSDRFSITGVKENDLANLQFTSGTTGFPKGCMLTHRYWLLSGYLQAQFMEISSDDINMTAQPYYYLDPMIQTMICIISGISLVIMPRFSTSKFWQTVKDNNVTVFYCIGSMILYLMRLEENPDIEKSHKLRIIYTSGLPPNFHEAVEKRWNVPVRETYGSTESGPDLYVPIEDSESVGSGAVGIAVCTKKARVVDSNGNEVPDGKTGELVIEGEPMMLGYWKDPNSTAEVLREGRFYTGDLAYKDKKGYFHWVQRIKDTVRKSGENISTTEVESVLIEHELIENACIVPVPDELKGQEVKAYIVLKEGVTKEAVPPEEIINFAKTKLASFKVPRYIEYVKDLPKTPSERIAKHKLIAAKKDLREGSYDAVDKIWR